MVSFVAAHTMAAVLIGLVLGVRAVVATRNTPGGFVVTSRRSAATALVVYALLLIMTPDVPLEDPAGAMVAVVTGVLTSAVAWLWTLQRDGTLVLNPKKVLHAPDFRPDSNDQAAAPGQ
jgi:hypothetical protein